MVTKSDLSLDEFECLGVLVPCHRTFIQPPPEPGWCLRRLAQIEQSTDERSFFAAVRWALSRLLAVTESTFGKRSQAAAI